MIFYAKTGRTALNRRLEALRAAGYPTSTAELTQRNELPEGAVNAAGVYTQAFAAFEPLADQVALSFWETRSPARRGVSPVEPMGSFFSEYLVQNRQCLARLHEAGGIEHCWYRWDYTKPVPELGDVRSCAQLLCLRGVFHAGRGDPNTVVASLKDGLRLADSLRRESSFVTHRVRIACHALTISALERVLSVAAFTDSQLRDLSAALASADGTLDLAEVLVAEQCHMIEGYRHPLRLVGASRMDMLQQLPGVWQRALVDALDSMTRYIEAARLPQAQRLAKFREVEARARRRSFLRRRVTAVALSRALGQSDLQVRARFALARTALAIERHRLATGQLPPDLDTLVPQYLEQVPVDPSDGRPIRYRHEEAGYVLWSVGADGQDNGGRRRKDVKTGEPCDWCFIVTR
jgi:hypothetical protein